VMGGLKCETITRGHVKEPQAQCLFVPLAMRFLSGTPVVFVVERC
jgi:hypothetical protein